MDLRDGKTSLGLLVGMVVVCLLLQLSVVPNLGPLSGLGNLALIFTCCIAMSEGGLSGIVAGFVSGLIYDLAAGSPVGLMSLELTLCAYLLGSSGRNRFVEGWADVLQTFGICCVGVCLVYHLALLAFGLAQDPVQALVSRFLPEVAFNIVLFLPFAFFNMGQVVAGSSLGFGAKSKARRGRFDTPGIS